MSDQYDKKTFFSRSIEDNMHSLYSVALRFTRNSVDAEDLVAEAASRAWSSLDSLEDRGRFRPWMFRILHNCYISDYRKKSVRPTETAYDELSESDDGSEIAGLLIHQSDEFLNWWANPEREVFNKLLGNDLLAAIENLPESFRVVVVLIKSQFGRRI
jgi:RNA polymerase sigma-70 factor (ECF subfamily)